MPLFHRPTRALLATLVTGGLVGALAVAAPVSAASGSFDQPGAIAIDATNYLADGYNDTDIALGDPTGAGSVYPSTITLDAPAGAGVSYVNVAVSLSHERLDDLDLMLVSPAGKAMMLMSDAGGDNAFDSFLYFYPWGSPLPDDSSPYNYVRPTDWDTTPGDTDTFPAPAPATAADSFEPLYGTAAAGDWSLYAVDDTDGAVGTIRDWSLRIEYTTPASPNPSTLAVSGLPSGVTDVNLTLQDLDLDYLHDTEFVLESPDGRRAHVLSDAGGWDPLADVTLTLDDEAAVPPERERVPTTGSYQPVNYDNGDNSEYVAGFDTKNLSAALSTFDGSNPNGTWKLYVSQQYCCNTGSITGGWSLQITTGDGSSTPVITSPANGSLDSDAAVTLTGTAAAGATVRVKEGSTPLRTTVAETGTWTVTLNDLAEGSHTFTATATDGAGNVSAPASVTVVVDTVKPQVATTTPKRGAHGVRTKISPQAIFTEGMTASSLAKNRVRLVVAKSGKTVAAKLSYSPTTRTLVINPRGRLSGHTTYRVTIKKGARDLAGNHLRNKITRKFTTK